MVIYSYQILSDKGRQGWIFDDTFREGSEPVRMVLGTTDCIAGLEIGLAGDEGPMPAMKYVALSCSVATLFATFCQQLFRSEICP